MKGRHLAPLKGLSIRPTSDRVREAIFNLLGQDVRDLKVLDLFAGTGSLGIEALSRGASRALFVDNSGRSLKLIEKNLALCGYGPLGSILKKDLIRGLPGKISPLKKKIDLVFIDPPYGKKLIPPLLEELCDKEILAAPSVVVAESQKTDKLPVTIGDLQLADSRTYGDTKISMFHYGDDR